MYYMALPHIKGMEREIWAVKLEGYGQREREKPSLQLAVGTEMGVHGGSLGIGRSSMKPNSCSPLSTLSFSVTFVSSLLRS